jgi:hypothetical protein
LGRIVLGRATNSVSFRQEVTDSLRETAHKRDNRLGFSSYRAAQSDPLNDLLNVSMPHWFLVAVFASAGVIPWTVRLKRQYSLRV